jgi:oxygen-independent coproporphyrinogen-3 oxidase
VTDNIALYLHFPFCQSRCHYCSFVSFAGRQNDINQYVSSVESELLQRASGQRIGSIFFGGGTPSLLPICQLAGLVNSIRNIFDVNDNAEITLEANPGTIDEPYLTTARKLGFNRLSLGVQSFDDRILSILGRIHTSDDVDEVFESARNAGFANVNLDLIYAIPWQSMEVWNHSLQRAANLAPEHISLYPLTLEQDVPMSRSIEAGEMPPIDPDLAAAQYELAQDFLAPEGYVQYEISNWSRAGYQCRHNVVYWQCRPYLGVGVAAHSFIDGRRRSNTENLDRYLTMFRPGGTYRPNTDEVLTLETQLSDFLMMGLRMNHGISFAEIRNRFGVDFLERYEQEVDELLQLELVEVDEQSIRLSQRGRLLGNEVFLRFIS